MLTEFLQDAFFAAIAAMGFAAISRPPKAVYVLCAVLAAAGHSVRFLLMEPSVVGAHIVIASFLAAFLIGTLAVFASPLVKVPAETCFFPALLPMIPGMYAYRSFGGLVMCIMREGNQPFNHYFYLFAHNGLLALFIILALTVGATLPVFIFKKISFTATR